MNEKKFTRNCNKMKLSRDNLSKNCRKIFDNGKLTNQIRSLRTFQKIEKMNRYDIRRDR